MPDSVLDIRKALDTSVATTGRILVPTIVDEGLRLYVETRSPLWNIIRKVPHDGLAYGWREQNGLPVASFGAELGALPAAQNATYIERTMPLKQIFIRGEVSGLLIEASRTVLNVLQREIENSALGMVRTLEQKLIAGNATTNPNEFDGIAVQITNTLNAAGTGGAAAGVAGPLTLSLLDQLIDLPEGGEPTHLIMMKAMHRRLWSVLQPQVRYMDTEEIEGGFKVPSYGGLPIIRMFENAAVLVNTILAPDMRLVHMPVLKNITYEELAHTRDSVDYFLKMYLGLVVEGAARFHAKMTNVSNGGA